MENLMQKFIDSYQNETLVLCMLHIEGSGFKHLTKKNKRPIKFKFVKGGGRKPFLGKSYELLAMEEFLILKFKQLNRIVPEVDFPIHAIYHFHFGPENSRSYNLCDLTNLFEIVSDALQVSGIIKNDRLIYSVDGSRKIMSNKTYLDVSLLRDNNNGLFEP